jgi:hypothetical protein
MPLFVLETSEHVLVKTVDKGEKKIETVFSGVSLYDRYAIFHIIRLSVMLRHLSRLR